MDDRTIWYLENIDVTGLFCPKKLGMGQKHVEQSYKKGDFIFLPDDQADQLFFLFEGRVKIGTYGNGGKEVTKAILSQGEVFGEMGLVGAEKHRDFAQAMEDTVLCVVQVKELRALMKEHSGLQLFMMKLLGSKILAMERRLEALIFKDSRTRVVEFLYNLARDKGQRVGFEMLVSKFIPHKEIASLTATSRQTVTTVLNELREKNILKFDRRRLLIRDMDLLAKEGNISV